MAREIKVGNTVKHTSMFGGVYKGVVKAVDGTEAWVLFGTNRDHSTCYLKDLKVVFPPPMFKRGDRIVHCGTKGTVLTSHINAKGVRYTWVEYDLLTSPCHGFPESELIPCP